ncbi:hypothetical protein [Stenotrophomonas panacihumi]|uniref:hypothetical protein n=1 Tax=Stenotrophomonas panacihumi TaxID=676599 RepID=UPI0011B2922A|nr:hypothetical protein [Stenotrophomonas panacihumi]
MCDIGLTTQAFAVATDAEDLLGPAHGERIGRGFLQRSMANPQLLLECGPGAFGHGKPVVCIQLFPATATRPFHFRKFC